MRVVVLFVVSVVAYGMMRTRMVLICVVVDVVLLGPMVVHMVPVSRMKLRVVVRMARARVI